MRYTLDPILSIGIIEHFQLVSILIFLYTHICFIYMYAYSFKNINVNWYLFFTYIYVLLVPTILLYLRAQKFVYAKLENF